MTLINARHGRLGDSKVQTVQEIMKFKEVRNSSSSVTHNNLIEILFRRTLIAADYFDTCHKYQITT